MSNISVSNKEFIWAQKYRPQTIAECILPDRIKKTFQSYADQKEVPHLLLTSNSPGTGKTTVAKALAYELGADLLPINASLEGGIDTIREKVIDFSSAISFGGGPKIVLLDEFDQASKSAQGALRATMEEFSRSTRFIITANYKANILEPITSRCVDVEFNVTAEEKPLMQVAMYKRCKEILAMEGVTCADDKVLVQVINDNFPDNRSILTLLQKYANSNNNVIDLGILSANSYGNVATVGDLIKKRSFKEVRAWVAANGQAMDSGFYSTIYNVLYPTVKAEDKLTFVITVAEFARDHASVPDRALHITALCATLMKDINFEG